MFALALGRKTAAAAHVRNRPGNRREEILDLPAEAEPALGAEATPTVGDIAVVTPIRKRYRAIVTRNRVERAVVEFDADETADFYVLAQDLIKQIPADAWSVDPVTDQTWGYLDRVEEVPAEVAAVEEIGDPVEDTLLPAATLSRRLRAMRSRLLRASAQRPAGGRKNDQIDASRQLYDECRIAAENAIAASDLNALRYLEDSVSVLLRSIPTTGDDGMEIPGAYDLVADATALYDTIVSEGLRIAEAEDTPSESLSRRRTLRSRRRGRKEDDGFDAGGADDASLESSDAAIEAELTAIEDEANAALDGFDAGTATADETLATLQALGERLIAIDTSTATSIALSEVSSLAAWLDSEMASLQEASPVDEDAPDETLSRRRRAA